MKNHHGFAVALLIVSRCFTASAAPPDEGVRDIGSRRELFVDRFLIDQLNGVRLELQRPRPAGVAIAYDRAWEGPFAFYTTIIKDGDLYRMYYRGASILGFRNAICYAESPDGVHWTKPDLGFVELDGSKQNNVIMPARQCMVPFLDRRPDVPADERYKANIEDQGGLFGYLSPDGLRWTKMSEKPIVPREFKNNFDSQNVMFWSPAEQRYVLYARHSDGGRRAQTRATSKDFRTWTKQTLMTYSDTSATVPSHHLYTSQVRPYFRAPHIYISLPVRFMSGRGVLTAEQAKPLAVNTRGGGAKDVSDGVLQTTRAGGTLFDRTFLEAFVRPGLGFNNWVSRTNYPASGIVPTSPTEMSIYVQRNYGQQTAHLQRMTLRLDGFASIHAPYQGGEMLTHPFRFEGKSLEINYSTSAAGGLRVEIQDIGGQPIAGYALDDCREMIGDQLNRVVTWKQGGDVSGLAGKPVRLRFVMKDADLYSLRFSE